MIVLAMLSAPYTSKFPLDEASQTPKCVTVPHEAVGVGNVIATLLLVVPVVPEDATVVVAPCVPAQFVSDGGRFCRAYALPETSVPPVESDGAAVSSPTCRPAGKVYACPRNSWSISLFSR